MPHRREPLDRIDLEDQRLGAELADPGDPHQALHVRRRQQPLLSASSVWMTSVRLCRSIPEYSIAMLPRGGCHHARRGDLVWNIIRWSWQGRYGGRGSAAASYDMPLQLNCGR
jgi:hypothetical protein